MYAHLMLPAAVRVIELERSVRASLAGADTRRPPVPTSSTKG